MLIIVDKNEQDVAPEIVKALKRKFSQVVVTNLPHRIHGARTVTSGDVNIPLDDGSVLAIERKTPGDFLQSIASGHIFDQVEVMAENAKYSAVIITGYYSFTAISDMVVFDGSVTNWRGSSVRSAISVIQFSGCPVIHCPPEKYPDMVAEVYNTVNKSDKRQSVRKNRIITFPPTDERVEFIAQLPGVKLELATSLLKFAGQMDNNADEDGYGTVASALHWATIMSHVDKASRPRLWGPGKVLTVRKLLGLDSDQYMAAVRELEGEAVEIDGTRYEKMPF